MKKSLLLMLAAVVMLAACNKNANEPESVREPEANEFCAEIDVNAVPQNMPAVNDGMTTKTYFSGYDVKWESDDVIKVNGNDNTTWTDFTCNVTTESTTRAYFSNSAASPYTKSEYHAFYGNCLTLNDQQGANGTLNATQTYEKLGDNQQKLSNLPMYAYSTNHWLTFHNICAVVKITVPCVADRIEISNTSNALNGTFTVVNNVAVINDQALGTDDPRAKTSISKSSGSFAADDVVYIAIPAGSYTNFCVDIYSGGAIVMSTGNSSNPFAPAANKIYTVSASKFQHKFVFSVSATKKVVFTKGNLWYKTSDQSVHFETNQTDYPKSWDANHVGHFTWHTNIASAASGTSLAYTTGNASTDFFAYNITVDDVQYTTLSDSEWKYLLGEGTSTPKRTNAANLRNNNISVDGVPCVAIAPDGYTDKSNFNSLSSMTLAYANQYGIICLPHAGYRYTNATTISNNTADHGMICRYRSCTAKPQSDNNRAYCILWNSKNSSSTICSDGNKNVGFAIRLVRIVQQ